MQPAKVKTMQCASNGGFRHAFGREVMRFASRPLYLSLTLVIPVIIFGILIAIFSGQVPRNLPVIVYDADHSVLSRQLIRMMDAAPTVHISTRVDSFSEGEANILTGKAYALIVVPHEFEKDVQRHRSPHVIEYYNYQYQVPAALIHSDMVAVFSTIAAGIKVKNRECHGEPTGTARDHVQPVAMDFHALFNPWRNYVYFLVSPLLPTMMQIFILLVTVYAIGIELKEGTAAEWLACAGGNTFKAIAAKQLPYMAVFGILGIFMNLILYVYLGVPTEGNMALLFTATLFLIAAYQSVGLLIVSITANLRLALSLAAFYAAPAFAFAGITYPTIGMTAFGRVWGTLLPLSHYLNIVCDQTLRGAPVRVSLEPLCVLLACAILLPLIAIPRVQKLMSDTRYWGRS